MPANNGSKLAFEWCLRLVHALWLHGVSEAFISPGSRSAPLTLSLVEHPGIRCHSVLDERSAAFMALGCGKDRNQAKQHPALFVCTSGTAVANAFPAVVESRMSATPLILLTADRPPVLRSTGASQTIDQSKIFGDYPVYFFDAGEPVNHSDDFQRIAWLGYQAVSFSISRKGPVHLNLPFRKPLEPTRQDIRTARRIVLGADSTNTELAKPDNVPLSTPDEHPRRLPDKIIRLLAHSKKPLAICGVSLRNPEYLFTFCNDNGIPVLNESGGHPEIPDDSNITGSCRMNHHSLVLQDPKNINDLEPDLIIRAGGDPVHRSTLHALSIWKAPQILFGDHPEYPDASMSATYRLKGSPGDYRFSSHDFEPSGGQSVLDEPDGTSSIPAPVYWLEKWSKICKKAEDGQRKQLENEHLFTDGHVYQQVLPLIGKQADTQVVISNSFPVRDYLQFGQQEIVQKLSMVVNRGASGIDGTISTAVGVALSSSKPVVLFTGDLAFLHDAGALYNLTKRKANLKIIVINNRGGTIFRMLPFEVRDNAYTEFFETPQNVDMKHIAKANDIPFVSVDSPDQLKSAWLEIDRHNIAIIECQTSTDASMLMRTSL